VITTKTKKTVADYMALPDEPRMELLEGEYFMSPSPNAGHQRIVRNLVTRLDAFIRSKRLGEVFPSPFDAVLSDETVLQPDVLFVAAEHRSRIRDRLYGAPDLAVEVLSAGNAERDRIVKRDLYAKYGVREYWIADPDARTVEVMTLERGAWRLVAIFGVGDALESPLLRELRLPVAELFE
jgi:Uma2 family endonuclease